MGLSTDFIEFLRDNCPQAFYRDIYPGLMDNTTHIIECVDMMWRVFNKSQNVVSAYAWAQEFRTFITSLVDRPRPDGVQMIIVLYADGLYTPKIKDLTREQRRADARKFPTKYPIEDPVIPRHLGSELETNWTHKMSYSKFRTEAMTFLVKCLVEGIPDSPNGAPIYLSSECSLVVFPLDGDSDKPPVHYTSSLKSEPLKSFQMRLGEGDFMPIAFALRLRRLQFTASKYQQMSVLEDKKKKIEARISERNSMYDKDDIDACADYEDDDIDEVLSRELAVVNQEIADVSSSTRPSSYIRLNINSNDSDLLVIAPLAYSTLDHQRIDIVLNLGTKSCIDYLTPEQVAELTPAQRNKVRFPAPPGPKTRGPPKLATIRRYFQQSVDVNALVSGIEKRFPTKGAFWSVALLALMDGSDLVPTKFLGGQGLKRVLNTVYDTGIMIVNDPKRPTVWHPEYGLIPENASGPVKEISTTNLPTVDQTQLDNLISELCLRSLSKINHPNATSYPFEKLLEIYNKEHANRGTSIKTGDQRESALGRGLYALCYYGIYGWNLDFRMPDPRLFGWEKHTSSNNNGEVTWKPCDV